MRRSRAIEANVVLSSLPALAVGAMLVLAPSAELLAAVPPDVPAASQLSSATDLRAEIAGLLAAQAADWSRGDVPAFASIYADDATFVAPSGMTQGRAALVERYRQRYPDRAAMGRLSLEILELRPGGESTASVVARWTLAYPDKPDVSGLTLLVFHRLPAGWRIVQDASM
ncbi:MAG: nuclear transport factor 2 family protein [Thermoanaerobaculia bacterium]|jgi:uncharacterized protein (TIGR02246 family)|nr:nuclear transport factor 2 family protein [Thermoanaerobaculia bacterium]